MPYTDPAAVTFDDCEKPFAEGSVQGTAVSRPIDGELAVHAKLLSTLPAFLLAVCDRKGGCIKHERYYYTQKHCRII